MNKYIFRGLRAGEISKDGLTAKKICPEQLLNEEYVNKQVTEHIVKGNISKTCCISFTSKLEIAKKHASEVFLGEDREKNYGSTYSVNISSEKVHIKKKNIICNGRKNKVVLVDKETLNSTEVKFFDENQIEQIANINNNKWLSGSRKKSGEVLFINKLSNKYIRELPWILVDLLTYIKEENQMNSMIDEYLTDEEKFIEKLIDINTLNDQEKIIFYLAYIKEYSTYEIAASIFDILSQYSISANNLMKEIELVKKNILKKMLPPNKNIEPDICIETNNKCYSIPVSSLLENYLLFEVKEQDCLKRLGVQVVDTLKDKEVPFYLANEKNSNGYQVIKFNKGITYLFIERNVKVIESCKIEEAINRSSDTDLYREKIINLFIPKGVEEIAENAFVNCRGLMYVHLPTTIKKIGDAAFRNCENLLKINLPNGIVEIGNRAFNKCIRLSEINLPDSVEKIGKEAFRQCSAIRNITIPKKIKIIEESTFDFREESCGGKEFFDSSLCEITLPSELVKIEDNAFRDCKKLKRIWINKESYPNKQRELNYNTHINELPCNLKHLGKGAFWNCETLENISLPSGIIILKSKTFTFCKGLIQVILPKDISIIEDDVFYYCKQLANIVLPQSIRKIGKSAFEKCSGLKECVLPQNIDVIKNRTFSGCEKLETIKIEAEIVEIEEEAFSECNALKNIVRKGNVTKVGGGAFKNCRVLQKVDFLDEIISIGMKAFEGCEGITNLVIPKGINKIGTFAFKNCTALEKVEFFNDINQIPYQMFEGCTKLNTVILNSNIEKVAKRAFFNCKSLTNMILKADHILIDEEAFSGCEILNSVEISSKVIEIEKDAFENCNKLFNIIVKECDNIKVHKKLLWRIRIVNSVFEELSLNNYHSDKEKYWYYPNRSTWLENI